MIRFLLVLLAFVSALLAFMFQETVLFIASGFLLLVSVVLLLLQVREQIRRRNRLRLPTELTPEDELRARGVLDIRPKNSSKDAPAVEGDQDQSDEQPTEKEYAPTARRASGVTEEELRAHGIVDVRPRPKTSTQKTLFEDPAKSEPERSKIAAEEKTRPSPKPKEPSRIAAEARADVVDRPAGDGMPATAAAQMPVPIAAPRRRIEVDAHLPVLQRTLGAHTVCLIDVDTETFVYHLRSVVSNGAVDNAGTEYPFAGFFLSDVLAETTVVDLGGGQGLDISSMGVIRSGDGLQQIVTAPVIREGAPAAFLVAAFEEVVDEACKEAVSSAAEFFGTLYSMQGDEPTLADNPLTSATREPEPLRLVKSNPRSAQRRIIEEEIRLARGKARPLALALVCLDANDELANSDETTIHQVEAWMRDCLESVTPDGRVEYFGQLGYGILQTRDVTDVEGWVKRAQVVFSRQSGPVRAVPVVGVAMLSDQHSGPDDLQADAFKALRAAYECGDSTILVG